MKKMLYRGGSTLRKVLTWVFTILLALTLLAFPAFAAEEDTCISCHGDYAAIHAAYGHDASSQVGSVVLFADNAHDDAGWHGAKPYFSVAVNCTTCHTTDLVAIHGSDCAKCHPTAYDQLGGPWNGTCQQGVCHASYHDDSISAHLPFEDSSNTGGNDCSICHDPITWAVTQAKCLNCHATYSPDTTPPVTTSDAVPIYEGGAEIVFSITDNGKVGIGTTFYRLNNGPTSSGMGVTLNSPGQHTLQFWSVDQAGNVESPAKSVSFSIISDTTPPTTTANVTEGQTYYQGATINFTATDNSASGVKHTYYQLNSDPTQTGDHVVIPVTPGTFNYTLTYWSEDWGYNVEVPHTVNFTVISGNETLRLIWGGSPSVPPGYGDNVTWKVRKGGPSGPLVRQGSAAYPWSGINDISVPIYGGTYYVWIFWEAYYTWDEADTTIYPSVIVDTPGQINYLYYP